ncbi:Bacterial transcriptional regulator [compost metagenome]
MVLTVLINRKQIIDIHRVHALKPITTSVARSRGRQRPLFRSGGSKILLSWLPRHQQRQIYLTHADDIRAHQLGDTWEEFRAHLDQIKKAGFYMSWGELETRLGAAVVPVFNPEGDNVAALNLLDSPENIQKSDPIQTKELLEDAAWKIRQRQAYPALQAEGTGGG